MQYRPLDLVSSALSSLPDVKIIEDDILADTSTDIVDVLRAANILHKAYFDEDTLSRMVRNLRRRLRSGGIMIVCRTDYGGRNNASLFRLNANGKFEVLARLNAGSDIEDLVLHTPA
jgi:chemotaxis methyl-accepting protein methylase